MLTKNILMMSEQERVIKTSFRIPKQLMKNVKRFCVESEMSQTDVITQALEEYLKKHKRGENSAA